MINKIKEELKSILVHLRKVDDAIQAVLKSMMMMNTNTTKIVMVVRIVLNLQVNIPMRDLTMRKKKLLWIDLNFNANRFKLLSIITVKMKNSQCSLITKS
jgi:hypothetical protein